MNNRFPRLKMYFCSRIYLCFTKRSDTPQVSDFKMPSVNEAPCLKPCNKP